MKKEMTLIWEKEKYSDQIKYLLQETFASRRMEMKGYAGRPMYKMCANFPMMKNAKYVSILVNTSIYRVVPCIIGKCEGKRIASLCIGRIMDIFNHLPFTIMQENV